MRARKLTAQPSLRGFSLLEVMVAIAILSVGMVMLLQVQTRSIQLAQQGRSITVATMLARGKLYDCEHDLLKKGFSVGDYAADGKFDEEGYSSFFWECHAYKPDLPVPQSNDIADAAVAGSGLGATADAAKAQNPDFGMQAMAPFFSQLSSILGDSVRELVVVVRWSDGGEGPMEEMRVATHVIDKTAVNNVSQMIQQQTKGLDKLTNPGGTDATTPGTNPTSGVKSPTGGRTSPLTGRSTTGGSGIPGTIGGKP